MRSTNESFTKAEQKAKEYLLEKGYKVIFTNYAVRNIGEIDIIAMDGETLVFAEVKYRSSDDYGDALETVSKAKQKKLIRAASYFLTQAGVKHGGLRFDVIGITNEKITHITDAFWAGW